MWISIQHFKHWVERRFVILTTYLRLVSSKLDLVSVNCETRRCLKSIYVMKLGSVFHRQITLHREKLKSIFPLQRTMLAMVKETYRFQEISWQPCTDNCQRISNTTTVCMSPLKRKEVSLSLGRGRSGYEIRRALRLVVSLKRKLQCWDSLETTFYREKLKSIFPL